MKKRIYVAGPYTRPDPVLNTRTAIQAGDAIWGWEFVPFVPHLTHFFHLVCPHPYEDWLALDLAWLECCDALVRLPGASTGADREVAWAKQLGLQVYFGLEEFHQWARSQA